MTSLSLPSHGAAQSAGAAASASALASDRSAANQRDAQDGSAFVALLGALDDAGAPTHPIGGPAGGNGATASSPNAQAADEATPAAWRSVSAVHSLGSGVLVALDKRFGATAAQDDVQASPEAPKAEAGDGADASAPLASGWASLLLSVAGATAAPQLPAIAAGAPAAPAAGGSTATLLIGDGAARPHDLGAIDMAPTPSDAAPATSTPMVALNAGAPPIDVKVVRSITFLGLDPTARATNFGRAPAGASSGPGSAASSPAASVRAEVESMASPVAASAKGDSSAMSSGEQSGRSLSSSGGDERAPGKVSRPTGGPSTTGSQAATAPSAAGAVQGAPGATSATGVPLVQIGQLADVVADAASGMDSPGGDASGLAKAGDGASAASMAPVKELDVQLNPKSLGALSIQMRLSNGKLNVTINAENADTLKLVANERGAISDRLKSLNFSVESITVSALDMAASTRASSEAAQAGTPGHGEAYQEQSGQTADGSTSGGRSFRGGGDERNPPPPNRSWLGEPGGDGNPGHRFV